MTETNVPRLRFKEFSGEWREEKAKEIFVNESIKNHEQEEVLASTQKDGIVFRKDMDIDIKFDKSTLKNYKYVTPGNIVISLRSFQGGFEISDKRGIISPAYTIMSFKDSKNNKDYWKQYLKTYKFIQSLKKVTFGIRDGRSISFTEFSTLKLKFTENKKEQQKIGSFFAKIDKLIELQTEKLEHLKKLKRAYLQKMFPQDEETVPRLRFSGFSGEWEENKLGDVYTINTGKSAYDSSNCGKYPIAGSTGIIGYDNEFDYEGNFLLVARVGDAGSTYCNSGKMKITDNTIFIDAEYENFLSGVLKNKNIKRFSVGSGRKLIKSSDLKKINVVLPEKSEQLKIDIFLNEFNNMIEAQDKKISTLKQQKKAYLQKMFI